MERVPLLTVTMETCLRIGSSLGREVLIVYPDLAVPPGNWEARAERMSVLCPDGRVFEAVARFIRSPVSWRNDGGRLAEGQRQRVALAFPDLTSDEIPKGSEIWVSREIGVAFARSG